MASKRRIRRRSCEGKVPYATKTIADHEVSKLRWYFNGGTWASYHCKWCGAWHVGRQSARQRQATADRRAALAE